MTQLYSKTAGSVSTSPILRLVTWYFSQSGKLLTPSRSTALQVRSSSVLLPCSGSLPAGQRCPSPVRPPPLPPPLPHAGGDPLVLLTAGPAPGYAGGAPLRQVAGGGEEEEEAGQ